MRLLLIIIGCVFVGFIVFNMLRQRQRQKKLFLSEPFDPIDVESAYENEKPQRYIDRSNDRSHEDDPLLENYATKKIDVKSPFENVIENKKEVKNEISEDEDLEEGKVLTKLYSEPKVQSPLKQPEPPKQPSDFIAISIIPTISAKTFPGYKLAAFLKTNQFFYGKQKIFHQHVNDNPALPILFSLASLVEPGFFEIENIKNKQFAGLVLFMQLPNVGDAISVFEKMLTKARQIADAFQGDLCDSKRHHLSVQMIQQYREQLRVNYYAKPKAITPTRALEEALEEEWS
jgi:cell division protein ZipA